MEYESAQKLACITSVAYTQCRGGDVDDDDVEPHIAIT